jgi:hypothetical protein
MNLPVQVQFATSLGGAEYTGQVPMSTRSATRLYREAPPVLCIPIEALVASILLPLHSRAKALDSLECRCRGHRHYPQQRFNPWHNLWICILIPHYQFAPPPRNLLRRYLATFHHVQKPLGEKQTETGITANSMSPRPCSPASSTPAHPNARTLAPKSSTTHPVGRQGRTR